MPNDKQYKEIDAEFDKKFTLLSGTNDSVLLKEAPGRMKEFMHQVYEAGKREVIQVMDKIWDETWCGAQGNYGGCCQKIEEFCKEVKKFASLTNNKEEKQWIK